MKIRPVQPESPPADAFPIHRARVADGIDVGAAHQVFDERNYNEVAKSSLGLEPAPF
jgi:hypothetical protein